MKYIILICTLLLCICSVYAQTKDSAKTAPPMVFTYIEQMPQFPGGEPALANYLSQNIHYPDSARMNNVQGRVYLHFIVNEDSTISNISVIRGLYPSCDAEAIRVLKQMPKWKPGKQNGKPVKVYYTIPVSFRLTDPVNK